MSQKTITSESRFFLDRQATKFIAEVSSNHNADLERCLRFVDTAADIGCWGIKFQLFKLDQMFTQEALAAKASLLEPRRNWELPVSFLPAIAERCHTRGIKLGCTPFYLDAIQELEPYVDFFKIASYEVLWKDLIQGVMATGKPVIISLGMINVSEFVDLTHNILGGRNKSKGQVSFLHCVSQYPTPASQCNLASINMYRTGLYRHFPVGWSDHSVNPGVIACAIFKYHAPLIEFHLDLDGLGDEYKIGHCWTVDKARAMIEMVRAGEAAIGNWGVFATDENTPERLWRSDPVDGLRPLQALRNKLLNGEQADVA